MSLTSYQKKKGYTLLELTVILLLVSLITGLAIPRLTALYDSFRWGWEQEEVIASLENLSYQAFKQTRAFKLTAYPAETSAIYLPLVLPEGWSLQTQEPILFRETGVCSGGTVYLHHRQSVVSVQLVPPFCYTSGSFQ